MGGKYMWIMYILISFILILFVILFVFPITIEIKDDIKPTFNKIKKYKNESIKEKHYVKIKILKFITV